MTDDLNLFIALDSHNYNTTIQKKVNLRVNTIDIWFNDVKMYYATALVFNQSRTITGGMTTSGEITYRYHSSVTHDTPPDTITITVKTLNNTTLFIDSHITQINTTETLDSYYDVTEVFNARTMLTLP